MQYLHNTAGHPREDRECAPFKLLKTDDKGGQTMYCFRLTLKPSIVPMNISFIPMNTSIVPMNKSIVLKNINNIHLLDRRTQKQSGIFHEYNCYTHHVTLLPGFMLSLPLQTSVAPSLSGILHTSTHMSGISPLGHTCNPSLLQYCNCLRESSCSEPVDNCTSGCWSSC